jgi:hypothetical protein
MEQWEYLVETMGDPLGSWSRTLDEELTQLGLEGWELVSAVPARTGEGKQNGEDKVFTEFYRLFFKRCK